MSTDSETLLQVVARQVEDIHYALGLGSDEDGAPVPPALPALPALPAENEVHEHQSRHDPQAKRVSGCRLCATWKHPAARPLQDGPALVSALGELIDAVAAAPAPARTLLASCFMCRNRLLYLLDTAPYAGSAYHQFGRRLIALPQNHALFHQNQQARDHGDARTPVIRGIRGVSHD